MAIYRYAPAAIDPICREIQKGHAVILAAALVVIVAPGFFVLPARTAAVSGALFAIIVFGTFMSTRKSGLERLSGILRAFEVELDEQRITLRDLTGVQVLERTRVTEAHFTTGGIWLRGSSPRLLLQVPGELEGFDTLALTLERWIPPDATLHRSPPHALLSWCRAYGGWMAAAALFVLSASLLSPVLVVPSSLLLAIVVVWYLTWCGRLAKERKWKILLPLTGCLMATALVLRAVALCCAWWEG